MLVDDPVHELETDEGDGEDDPRVLVDITGGDAKHLVNILWSDYRLGHQSGGGGGRRRTRRVVIEPLGEAAEGRRAVRVVVLGDGVLPAPALAVPRGVVHLGFTGIRGARGLAQPLPIYSGKLSNTSD